MFRLKSITRKSLIFVEIKEERETNKKIELNIGDNVIIKNTIGDEHSGEICDFCVSVYECICPYLTIFFKSSRARFHLDRCVELEILSN